MSPPSAASPAVSPAALPVMLAIVFISLIGFGVVLPLLPALGAVYKAEAWQITLLFAAYSAGQFAGELFWGRLSDRIGRRPVMLITILGLAVGYMALAFSPTIWLAVLARLVGGFFGGNLSTMQGYVVDVTPREKVGGRLGLIGAAVSAGFAVGPALGGLLARPDLGAAGFRPPLELAGGLCLLAALGAFFFLKETRDVAAVAPSERPGPWDGIADAARHPQLRMLLASGFVAFTTFSGAWSVLGLWGEARFAWGPREIGAMMGFIGILGAVFQGLVAALVMRRLGASNTLSLGIAVMGGFMGLLAFSPWSWLGTAMVSAAVCGNALILPAVSTLVVTASAPERQGSSLGASNAIMALGRVAGPMAGGFLFTLGGPAAPFVFAALGVAPAILFARLAQRAQRAARLG